MLVSNPEIRLSDMAGNIITDAPEKQRYEPPVSNASRRIEVGANLRLHARHSASTSSTELDRVEMGYESLYAGKETSQTFLEEERTIFLVRNCES